MSKTAHLGKAIPFLVLTNLWNGPTSTDPVPELLHWKFNEGTGTVVGAAVGPAGTTNSDWLTPGKSGTGSGLDFNGTNDIATSNTTVAYASPTITVMGWFKPDTVGPVASPGNLMVLAENTAASWLMFIGVGGDLIAYMSADGTNDRQEATAAELFAPGAWHHVAVIFENSANSNAGDATVYIDGALSTTTIALNTKTTGGNFPTGTVYLVRAPAPLSRSMARVTISGFTIAL